MAISHRRFRRSHIFLNASMLIKFFVNNDFVFIHHLNPSYYLHHNFFIGSKTSKCFAPSNSYFLVQLSMRIQLSPRVLRRSTSWRPMWRRWLAQGLGKTHAKTSNLPHDKLPTPKKRLLEPFCSSRQKPSLAKGAASLLLLHLPLGTTRPPGRKPFYATLCSPRRITVWDAVFTSRVGV